MKRIILSLVTICIVDCLFGQKSLELLEKAYINFEASKYKDAVKYFKKYYELEKGSKEDYYFTAASLAQTGNISEALKYAEKASVGIETLGMMLADSLFIPIHTQLSINYKQIKDFYSFYNNPRHYDREFALAKIDSLYKHLNSKKIVSYDILDIAKKFSYANDTLKSLFYMKETILNDNVDPKFRGELRDIGRFGDGYTKLIKDSCPFFENINYWTLKSYDYLYMHKNDSAALCLDKLINTVPESLIIPEILYNASCAYSLTGNFEKSGSYLIRSIDRGFEDMKHLFQDTDLFPLFSSPEGQLTLKYIIAKFYRNTFENTDYIFKTTSSEYSKSKRLIHDYLQAKEFNAQIPRAFGIFTNYENNVEKTLHVPLFWEDSNIQKIDFEYVFSITKKSLIQVSIPKNEAEKIILCKKIGNSLFADNAGNCYIFPSENLTFIQKVQNGDITLSRIPTIRAKHLKPLRKNGFWARMFTGINSDDEVFIFAIEMGIENLSPSLTALFKETPPQNLSQLIHYIDYCLWHSVCLDKTIEILRDTAYYNSLSVEDKVKFREVVRQLNEIMFFESIDGRKNIEFPRAEFDWIYNTTQDKQYVANISKLGNDLNKYWSDYKKENPFKLPKLLISEQHSSWEINENQYYFYIDTESMTPVFYDPINLTVEKNDSTYNFSGTHFLKTGCIGETSYIFTPSHHTNPHELLILKDSDTTIVRKLTTIADTLKLKGSEYVNYESGGFDIKYDRFYVKKAFDDVIYIWHDNDTAFYSSLSKTNNYNIQKKYLITPTRRVYSRDTTIFLETSYCLNSLKAKQVDDKLYILCNSSISQKPYNTNGFSQKSFLFKLDANLQVEKEISIPQDFLEGFDPTGNPDVELISTSDKLFAFVWPECCGPQKGYYQVFDKGLNPQSELIEISENIGQQAMKMPPLSAIVANDEVYIVYPTIENEEEFLCIEKLTTSKNANEHYYLLKNRGVILQDELINEKDNNVLKFIYTERFNDRYFYRELPINKNLLIKDK